MYVCAISERPILVYDGVSSTARRRQKQTLKAIKVSKDTAAGDIIVSVRVCTEVDCEM